MKSRFFLMTIVALHVLYHCAYGNSTSTIKVWSNCTHQSAPHVCIDLDSALQNLASNTTLYLQPGNHVIKKTYHQVDLQNITIVGSNPDVGSQSVTITCRNGQGLSFVRIVRLRFAHLTIQNCGMEGSSLTSSLDELKGYVHLFFVVPSVSKIAVFLGYIEDLEMKDVSVTNTTGLGLLGVNIVGNSSLVRTNFTYNRRSLCIKTAMTYPFANDSGIFRQIGGGAYFLYVDFRGAIHSLINTQLSISHSQFSYNSDCSYAGIVQTNFQYYRDDPNNSYTIGAGGGLSLFVAQQDYSVDINVSDTNFSRNDARYGGGVHVGLFASIPETSITMHDCNFEENGQRSDFESYSYAGAGLAVFADLLRPRDIRNIQLSERTQIVKVTDSTFDSNHASTQGGGLLAYSLFNTPSAYKLDMSSNFIHLSVRWEFRRCKFTNNSATYGSGASFYQRVNHGFDGGLEIILSDVTFEENSFPDFVNRRDLQQDVKTSALDVRNVIVVIHGELSVRDSIGSGMLVDATYVILNGSATFERNSGHVGGGMHLHGDTPILSIYPKSELIFRENNATIKGGAIYYDNSERNDQIVQPLNYTDCFLFLQPLVCYDDRDCRPCKEVKPSCSLNDSDARLEFTDNKAPLGSILFGSTLQNCPWDKFNLYPDNISNLTYLQYFYREYPNIFMFDEEPVGVSLVTTAAAKLHAKIDNGYVFPGEETRVELTVLDHFGQSIPGTVSSLVSGTNGTSSLGDSGFWFVTESTMDTPLRINGTEDQNVRVIFYTTETLAFSVATFEVMSCPIGFAYNHTTFACECSNDLVRVTCNLDSLELEVPNNVWIGPSSDETNSTSDLIVDSCVLSYCVLGDKLVQPPDFDSQCVRRSHKTGVLCGACMEGYSRVFGSSDCKQCDNTYLGLIPIFALGGIVLFVLIAVLGITIDKGWINVILFYSNLATFYLTLFSPLLVVRIFFLPASLISLQLGIPTCFFENMNSLTVVALQLLFPAYLYFLMIIYALLCKRYSILLSHNFSPVKTFVTLIVMSYVSVLITCLEILAGVEIETLSGTKSIRWVIDPNQVYFEGGHAALGTLAIILLLIYILPFSLVLLFPAFAYKYLKKFAPFFDAFWGAYKPKYRFWLGLKLIIRALIIVLVYTIPSGVLLVISGIMLVFLSQFQLTLLPFKEKWINIVDSFLTATIVTMTIGGLYQYLYLGPTGGPQGEPEFSVNVEAVFVALCLSSAYAVFVGIFILHLVTRFPALKKPRTWFKSVKKVTSTLVTLSDTQSSDTLDSDDIQQLEVRYSSPPVPSRQSLVIRSHHRQFLSPETPLNSEPPNVTVYSKTKDFSQLRESLLSDSYVLETRN